MKHIFVLQRALCSKRTLPCKYCNRPKVVTAHSDHESFCGRKTEQCKVCYEWIMLKNSDSHQSKLHGSIVGRFMDDRAVVFNRLELKGNYSRLTTKTYSRNPLNINI